MAASYDVRQITHNINPGAFINAIAMPKRVTIEAHLSLEELENGYRQASEPVKRTHYQIIWLLAKGMTTQEVVAATGYSRSWIYELVWGYNRIGPETLGDQRMSNQGSSEPLLDDVQQALLWQALQEAPAEGGQWNGRKVADWIADVIGRPVSRQRGWEYLKQMRFRLRVPRPEHTESSLEEQAQWKKKFGDESRTNTNRKPRSRRGNLGDGRTDARRLATASLSSRFEASHPTYLG
jgi:transposase